MPTTLIPALYQPIFAALLVLGGLIAWAAGYRFFRLVLTLFGFFLGALFVSSMLDPTDRTLLIFGALGGGAVGALVMFFGYFVGVALVGAGIGALGVHLIWSRIGSDPHPFVVILAAVAGAAGAMALQRYVIIIATSFGGAWTMLVGGLALSGQARSLARPDVWVVYPFDPTPRQLMVLGAWMALGLIGIFIQLRFTGGTGTRVKAKAG